MFDFPASPAEGQIFTPPGGPSYVYKSPVWTQPGSGTLPLTGPIMLTGATPEARIHFTQADIGFGVRPAGSPAGSPNRFVWNDKPDLSGKDIMELIDQGDLTLNGTGFTAFIANAPAGAFGSYFAGQKAGLPRWLMYLGDAAAESGGNAGSNFYLFRYNDDGAGVAAALSINRANMGATFGGNLYANGVVQSSLVFQAGSTSVYLATTGAGIIALRPNGAGSAVGQMTVDDTGDVVIGADVAAGGFISSGTYVLSTGGFLIARGAGAGNAHLQFQNNVGGTTGYCYFNNSSNTLLLQNTTGSGGVLQILSTAELRHNNNLVTKPTAGQWTATSDARIKNVVGDYEVGLDAILQITPRIFTYKGNETSEPPGTDPLDPDKELDSQQQAPYTNSMHYQMALDGTEVVGLIAQEVEGVMPTLVSRQSAYIDGEPVDDLRNVDPTNLQYAMVNAIKELAARVEALETV